MSYPKWIYHKTEAPKIVNSEAEHEQAGKGWEETPAAFDQESDEKKGESEKSKGQTPSGKTPIQETDFTKWKVADLKAYLIEKGVEAEDLEGLKKDDLIAKIGAL